MKRVLLVMAAVVMVGGCGTTASYTPDKPFTNTLGMKFVSVPRTKVQFCIWETRVRDYATYAAANAEVNASWKRPLAGPAKRRIVFTQTDTHPVVSVSWDDAQAFCAWLTKKELAEGKLKAGQRYRLPTDAEWSVAVGLGKEKGNTIYEKGRGNKGVYPWGKEWPPPKGVGNYYKSEKVDNFDYSSPVGSFAANKLGLYDMGGNAMEWCEDAWKNHPFRPYRGHRVVRGHSWNTQSARDSLLSSARSGAVANPSAHTWSAIGFRCVLTNGSGG